MFWFVLGKVVSLGTTRIGIVLMTAVLAIQGYLIIQPNRAPLDPVRADASDQVTNQVVDVLGTLAGNTWTDRYVKVAKLRGDYEDRIRSNIEKALQVRTNCKLVADTMLSELRDEAAAKAARIGLVKPTTADAWKTVPAATFEDALNLAKNSGLDFVIYGNISDFRAIGSRTYLSLSLGVVDVAAGKAVLQKNFQEGDTVSFADLSSAAQTMEQKSPRLRVAGWVLFILLAPLCTARLWTNLLDRESRMVNAASLLFLTAADALIAWALMGFRLGSVWRGTILFCALGIAGIWNLFILGAIERRRAENKFSM